MTDNVLGRLFRIGTVAAMLIMAATSMAWTAGPADWPPYAIVRDESSIFIRWRTSEPSQDRLTLDGEGGKGESRSFAESSPLLAHSALLDNMRPGALYRFRIEGTNNTGMEGQLRVPRRGCDSAFFVVGDTQASTIPGTLDMELTRQRIVIEAMAKDPTPADFLVHTGDLVETGAMPEWTGFFRMASPLTARMPLFAVQGNHDARTGRFVDAFAFPTMGKRFGTDWHQFTTENALFIFLNLNFQSIPQVSETTRWLNLTLEQFKSKKWKFIFTHQPIFSNVERDSHTPFQSLFEPLFLKYGVDVVFSGHHHAYQRIQRKGITYIISGGGGAPTYSPLMDPKREETVRTEEKTMHYLRGRIAGNAFILEVRLAGRETGAETIERLEGEMDRFERSKP